MAKIGPNGEEIVDTSPDEPASITSTGSDSGSTPSKPKGGLDEALKSVATMELGGEVGANGIKLTQHSAHINENEKEEKIPDKSKNITTAMTSPIEGKEGKTVGSGGGGGSNAEEKEKDKVEPARIELESALAQETSTPQEKAQGVMASLNNLQSGDLAKLETTQPELALAATEALEKGKLAAAGQGDQESVVAFQAKLDEMKETLPKDDLNNLKEQMQQTRQNAVNDQLSADISAGKTDAAANIVESLDFNQLEKFETQNSDAAKKLVQDLAAERADALASGNTTEAKETQAVIKKMEDASPEMQGELKQIEREVITQKIMSDMESGNPKDVQKAENIINGLSDAEKNATADALANELGGDRGNAALAGLAALEKAKSPQAEEKLTEYLAESPINQLSGTDLNDAVKGLANASPKMLMEQLKTLSDDQLQGLSDGAMEKVKKAAAQAQKTGVAVPDNVQQELDGREFEQGGEPQKTRKTAVNEKDPEGPANQLASAGEVAGTDHTNVALRVDSSVSTGPTQTPTVPGADLQTQIS